MAGQRQCRFCGERGHNIRGCSEVKAKIAQEKEQYKDASVEGHYTRYYGHFFDKTGKATRTCSYCKEQGHTKRTCTSYRKDNAEKIKNNVKFRYLVREELFKKAGMNIGSLIYAPPRNGNAYNDSDDSVKFGGGGQIQLTEEDRNHCYVVAGYSWNNINYAQSNWDAIQVIKIGGQLAEKFTLRFPFNLAGDPNHSANATNPIPLVNGKTRLEGLTLSRNFCDFVVLSPTSYDEDAIPSNWELGVEGLDNDN